MSALTERISEGLRGMHGDETLQENIRKSEAIIRKYPHFTLELFEQLPYQYYGGDRSALGVAILAAIDELTVPEMVLCLCQRGKYDDLTLCSSATGRSCAVTNHSSRVPWLELMGRAFGKCSNMTVEDFQAVLPFGKDAREAEVDLFLKYWDASSSLGYLAGDFFDWYGALASVAGYKASQIREGKTDLVGILQVVEGLGAARMINEGQVAGLARNVAELHSIRGLRSLRIELLRALRSGDSPYVKEVSRDHWGGARLRPARILVQGLRKVSPEQKEH